MTITDLKKELRAATSTPAINTLQVLAWLYEVVEEVEAIKIEIAELKGESPTE